MIPVEMLDDLKAIVGDENVSTDPTELYVYGADASLHLVPPGAIVKPASTAEVSDVVKTCQKYHISLTPRGAATSLAGQDLNLDGGLILDMRRMNKILEISIPDRLVRAQPGIIYGKLNIALKKKGFFFPPEPGSATFCTLGGMVGNNASGMGSVKYGPTRMHVLDLEVVLPNGEIMHTGTRVIKSSATYDLTQLFVGSGGTLGVITEVMLRITPLPKFRETLIVSFDHVRKAAECAVAIQQQGVVPEALELLSSLALSIIKDGFPTPPRPETLAEMGAMLFIEVTGNTDDATKSEAQIVYDICQNYAVEVVHIQDPIERDKWWHVRDSLAQKLAKVRQEKWFNVVISDIGVPTSQVPNVLEEIYAITKQDGMPKGIAPYGHIGDGNLHITTTADRTSERGREITNNFSRAVLDLVKSVGGTLTAEHGPGFLKGIYVEDFFGPIVLSVLRAIKHAIDPENIMNPGQMGLDFAPFGEKPTSQFIKSPEDFAVIQKGGDSA